jgi:GT2 family glycosyltransferase/SAM-dependent methyltransferase
MADLRPRDVVHVDLAAGVPGDGLDAARGPLFVVVWWRHLPLGYEHLYATATTSELAPRLARLVAPAVGRRMLGDGFPPPRPGFEPVVAPRLGAVRELAQPLRALDTGPPRNPAPRPTTTLAICTRDRPAQLERCLDSIGAAAEAPDEVVVVDNAPHLPATQAVAERFPGLRYIAEPRPGLSAARNAAVQAATSDVLAFVDDDAVVHPRWLAPLRDAFAEADVMAVTGLVLPAELDTPAQVAFEILHGGLGRGCQRERYGRDFLRATVAQGMPVWQIGAGANMAIRRAAFDLVGDFDERLGAGAAGCSEDSELWYRLIAAGWACRYEPDSVVFHHHRRDAAALATQIRDYTRGHVAALFVQFARHRHAGNLRRAFVAMPRYLAGQVLRDGLRPVAASAGFAARRPVNTRRAELSGYVRGLAHLPLAAERRPPRHKAALGPFLGRNPFGRPYTIGFFYREKMRAIHRIAPDAPARDVLEVGGGRSGLARLLYPEALTTTVDVDEAVGASEVNRGPRTRFVLADATDLPFPDASFDVVTFFDVLEHVVDDGRAAAEALRVLRPGGIVLVTSPSRRWRFPYYRALAPICPTDDDVMADWGHVRRGYEVAELTRLFGRPPVKVVGFISPLTALGHDLAWARLPEPARRVLCGVVSPLTWAGYALQPATRVGTELAACWRKPDAVGRQVGAAPLRSPISQRWGGRNTPRSEEEPSTRSG